MVPVNTFYCSIFFGEISLVTILNSWGFNWGEGDQQLIVFFSIVEVIFKVLSMKLKIIWRIFFC